ncbi:MAG: fibronectin type III-like domain-contianing protein, partial [Proteiniphilum sp.]
DHQGFQNYNMEGRTYRYMKEEPLYPFGHGLSYATFSYGEAQLSSKNIHAADGMKISIPVTNSSSRDGDEVVQLYVKRNNDPEAPLKSLRAFRRITLKAGETKEVKLTIHPDAFAFYDDRTDGLIPKEGSYTLLYGGTSAERGLKSVDITVE